MARLNNFQFIGNLTRDPELRYAQSGMPVCRLGLAVNDEYEKDGEKIETTNFFDITVYGKTGENCANYLAKGKQVYIDGRIKCYKYEKDGVTRTGYDFIANNVQFLGKKGDRIDNNFDDVPF